VSDILIAKLISAVCNLPVLRIILLALGFLGIAVFALPLCVPIINMGNVFGMIVSLIILLLCFFCTPLHRLADSCMANRAGKTILIVTEIVLLAGIVYCFTVSMIMLYAANKKPDTKPRAMIVLGCKVRGSEPSMMLYRRIQAAYDAMQQYPEMLVIASGGQGNDEEISEAQCIYENLIAMGADETRIIKEEQSTTTSENMQFSKQLLAEHGIAADSVILIASDGYHELRAQMLAGYEGIPNCYPVSARTSWYLLPTYIVREWFGVAHALVFHS